MSTENSTTSDGRAQASSASVQLGLHFVAKAAMLQTITVISRTGLTSTVLRELAQHLHSVGTFLAQGEGTAFIYDRGRAAVANTLASRSARQALALSQVNVAAIEKFVALSASGMDMSTLEAISEAIEWSDDADAMLGDPLPDPVTADFQPVDIRTAMRSLSHVINSDPGYAAAWRNAIATHAIAAGVDEERASALSHEVVTTVFAPGA